MGRKKIEPNEKKTLVRVFVRKKIIDSYTTEEMQEKINKFVKQLEKGRL